MKVLLIVVVVAILGLGGWYLYAKSSNPGNSMYNSNSGSQNVSPTSSAQGTSPAMSKNTVTLTANGFVPQSITISAGESVTWVNHSGQEATVNSDPHPIHTDYPPLNLGSFADGATLSLTFPTAGTHGYHNHLNPSETGTVIVK